MKKLLILFLVLITSASFGQTKPHWLQVQGTPAIDVRSYGAKGDGVTDDTAEIQAALDTKQPVLISSGTFLISSALKMYPGQTLTGIDRNCSVIKAKTNILMLYGGVAGSVSSGFSIKDVTLDRSIVTASNWHIHLINPSTSVIDGVAITGYPTSTKSGIAFDDGSGATAISGSFLNDIRNTFVNHGSVLLGTTDGSVRGCTIYAGENSDYSALNYAVQVLAGNNYIQNNFFIPASVRTGLSVGVSVVRTSYVFIQDNYFDGSYDYVESGYAVSLSTTSYVNVSGNHFWNIYRGGVNIQNSFRVLVTNNIFYGNNRADSFWHDVVIESTEAFGCNNISVTNNIFDRDATHLATESYAVFINDLASGTSTVFFNGNSINGRYSFYEVRGTNEGNSYDGQIQSYDCSGVVATGTASTIFSTPTFKRAPTLSEITVTSDNGASGMAMRVTNVSSSSVEVVHPVPVATTTIGLCIKFH